MRHGRAGESFSKHDSWTWDSVWDTRLGQLSKEFTMLKAVLVAVPFVSCAAFACPDISGTFHAPESKQIVFKFEQTQCNSIARTDGYVADDGSYKWASAKSYKLDGTPLCDRHNTCKSAKASERFIEWSINFDSTVATKEHGRCQHTGYKLMKNSEGNLQIEFNVHSCRDGYSGPAVKVFPKL